MTKLIHFERPKYWDVVSVVVYALVTSYLYWMLQQPFEPSVKRQQLLIYSFASFLFIHAFNYKAMRNATVYGIWLAFGLLHLLIYTQFKDDPSLLNYINSLQGTVMVLLLYQLFRILSLKFSGVELAAVTRSGKALFDARRNNTLDFAYDYFYNCIYWNNDKVKRKNYAQHWLKRSAGCPSAEPYRNRHGLRGPLMRYAPLNKK